MGPESSIDLGSRLSPDILALAPDKAAARQLLGRYPPIIVRDIDLDREPSAQGRARMFVHATCTESQLDVIRNDAGAVAAELVANAVQHAGNGCRLAVRHRRHGLTIAVCDGSPDRLPTLRPFAEGQGLPGLFTVSARSLHWGVNRGRDTKCVWAFLPTTAPASYSRMVRKAARDAVRAVLMHGVPSPDAAKAVRQLVAQLTEQHGTQFVRGLADALMVELVDATFAIATMNGDDEPPVEETRLYGDRRTDVGHSGPLP
jgi:anti-sigma regulatory factor (Ser/Thr protein kinase)